MNNARLEAFSDGVIAIIITTMVLELKAPEGSSWENIKPLMPKFICYFLSFLFVAIYWVNHHHLLHSLVRINAAVMWANMNLLFWLSLVPFTTAWMGENHFDGIKVSIYACLALLCSVADNILQLVISKQDDRQYPLSKLSSKLDTKSILSILLYAASIPIAWFVNPAISGGLFLVVSIIWLIPDKKLEENDLIGISI